MDYDDALYCPKCGPEEANLHPVEIAVQRGTTEMVFTADGVVERAVDKPRRGVAVVVTLTSETCDHLTYLDLFFNKGSTFLFSDTSDATPADRERETVWRN